MAQVEPAEENMSFVTLDPRFDALIVQGAQAEQLWTGGSWTEGPAWFPGYLLWSDIPSNRILRWDAATGLVTTFREPSAGANGNTVDRQGRLVTCEGSTRQLTRTETAGLITVLAHRADGLRFNSPNDVVVKSDGTIWFTDPSYGGPDYQGVREMAGCHVWRLDPATGALAQMTTDFVMPNGLAFSLDETLLYIIDTGSTEGPGNPNHIRRFTVTDQGLTGGEVFATSVLQALDGLRLDVQGNLWCGEGDGVHVYAPDGTMIGQVTLPERAANLCFGDGWLYMTATTSLYRIAVATRGGVSQVAR
jgi:gluconolactonase